MILPTTLVVHRDEPCVLLTELNLQSPGNHGLHRYQIIIVVRDDKPAEFRTDMGLPTKDEEFRVMGAVQVGKGQVEVLHTVAELMEIADYLRERRSGWTAEIEPRDLIQGYRDYSEELPLWLRHSSVSGPLFTKSRS